MRALSHIWASWRSTKPQRVPVKRTQTVLRPAVAVSHCPQPPKVVADDPVTHRLQSNWQLYCGTTKHANWPDFLITLRKQQRAVTAEVADLEHELSQLLKQPRFKP